MNSWKSLAGRLFKLVFSWYLALAVVVTTAQLAFEYSAINRNINNDLESLGRSFAPGITDAVWVFDRPQLNAIVTGIVQSAVVTGARVESPLGETIVQAGKVPRDKAGKGLLAPYQHKDFPLRIKTPRGELKPLGVLMLYSDRTVALLRIRYSFVVILINSLIKTAGLWLIFYLVITRSLARPLSNLTDVVSRIEFAAESDKTISLDYPHHDELGRLLGAVDKMQHRLAAAREQLEVANRELEQTVAKRTTHLSEVINFNQTILLNSPLSMAVYAADGQCVLANEAYAQLLGATREALLARNFRHIASWQESGLLDECLAALAYKQPRRREIHVVSSFGKKVCLDCRILPILINGEDHLLTQFFDLTERIRHEEQLRQLAFYDPLTQLPNRRLMLDRLEHAMRTSRRQNSHIAVLFIDLNRFKQLNDTYGHDVGDKLLVQAADRMQQAVRASDTVARFGGDEFVILIEGLGASPEQAAEYADSITHKIRQAMSEEYLLGELRYKGSASIGVKLFLGDDGDPDQLLKETDMAMYEEKKRFKG
jgi:diguanylate cyclase (GGDEF)-like protein/PAS domain S-box-containing protein